MLALGSTFLGESPRNGMSHLYILIASEEKSDKGLIVNITSFRDGCDPTCILNPGEHPFIKHKSVINYADSSIAYMTQIQKALEAHLLKPYKSVSQELLKKIQSGGLASPSIPIKNRVFLSSNINLD